MGENTDHVERGEAMRKVACFIVVASLTFMACASSKMSVSQPPTGPATDVDRLAIAPGSGVLGEAIALELFNAGITVIDANEVIAIVGRVGLDEFEVTSAKGYAALRDRKIGAVLVAKATMARDGTPESAAIRVTGTTSGEIIAGITWQNGRGGRRGSIADRTMRKNLSQAAQEIARELIGRLRRN